MYHNHIEYGIIEPYIFVFKRENVWSFFVKRSAENMRIALSMSPSGDILRARCRSYPGLVNCTTIDWIFPWPEQALLAVANVTLRDVSLIKDDNFAYKFIIKDHFEKVN